MASGQYLSMSWQIPTITGMVRRARKMPEGPRVSPTLVSTPYFLGISMSWRQTLTPPGQDRADHGIGALERLGAIQWWPPPWRGNVPSATMRSTARLIYSRRSGSMSISASGGILQEGKGQDVPHQAAGETKAAGSDKGDFRHEWTPLLELDSAPQATWGGYHSLSHCATLRRWRRT